jgi:putative membrane protein
MAMSGRTLAAIAIFLLLGAGSVVIGSPVNAQPFGDGWGGERGGWNWYGPSHMIIWLLILAVVIAGAVWFMRTVAQGSDASSVFALRASALDILEQRYARGEINREEYLEKKRDLAS